MTPEGMFGIAGTIIGLSILVGAGFAIWGLFK